MPVIYFVKIYKILIFQTTFNNNDHKMITKIQIPQI